jgi:hypothetical protein
VLWPTSRRGRNRGAYWLSRFHKGGEAARRTRRRVSPKGLIAEKDGPVSRGLRRWVRVAGDPAGDRWALGLFPDQADAGALRLRRKSKPEVRPAIGRSSPCSRSNIRRRPTRRLVPHRPVMAPPRMGQDGDMSTQAELSSITSTLGELTSRVTAMATEAAQGKQVNLASELYEVERAMTGALRRLERIIAG